MVKKISIFLFFLAVASSVTHTLWAYDVWWHLKTGEWIFQTRVVPQKELFSFTVPDHPWINLSWGFQLFLYIAFRLGGIPGMILFKVCLVLLTFSLLLRFFYGKVGLFLLLPILGLSLLALHERLVVRPEVLSYLFLTMTLLLLEKDRLRPTRWVYALPFLLLVWVNCHALFILGLLVIGVYALGTRRHLLLLGLSSLATLLNPYGLKGALFPLTLFTRISGELPIFTQGIGEFIRPLAISQSNITLPLYWLFLTLTPLSFLLNRKRFPLVHAALLVFFVFLSLLARRNIAPFALVASFLILKNLESSGLSFVKKEMPAVSGLLLVLLLLAPLPFVTGAFYEEEKGLYQKFGFGISPHRYPVRAADFIEHHPLEGNLFNTGLDVGNYLIYRFFPERKVFMDGRLEVYGEAFFREQFRLLQSPHLWPEWVQRYRLNIAILDHTIQKHEGLLRWLTASEDWKPVYLDGKVVIFLQDTPSNRTFIKTHGIDFEKDPPPAGDWVEELRLADFYGRIGRFEKAEALYRKNLVRLPRQAALYHNLGHLLRQKGQWQEALSFYLQAIRLQPKEGLFLYSLGTLYAALGEKEAARQALEKSVRLNPYLGEAHYQLGRFYAIEGNQTKAEKAFRRITRADPVYPAAQNALGILYAEKGELEKAEKTFKGVLEADPASEEARQNLKRLEELKSDKNP